MKYLVRAGKYFVEVTVLLAAVLGVLMLVGAIPTDIDVVFQHGWTSVGWILLMFAGVSLLYPRFGYSRRSLAVPGEYAGLRPGILAYMEARGYRLEKEEGEDLAFVQRSAWNRLTRLYEDRVTLTRDLGGFQVEGPNRDVVRVLNGLEYKLRNNG